MYLGNNLLTCPLGSKRFFVDIYANLPNFNMGESGHQCLLANISWSMQLFRIMSWAPWRWSRANALTPGRLVGGVMIGSPRDGKALKGWQTWAQPLGWPLSHCIRKQCLELLEAQRAQKAPRGSGSYEGF